MKRLLATLLLLAVTLAVLLWRMPASVLLWAIPSESSRALQLHRIEGTLWRGSAQFSVVAVPPALSLRWFCRPQWWPLGAQCDLGDAFAGSVTLHALSPALTAARVTAVVPLQVSAGAQVIARSPRVFAELATATLSRERVTVQGNLRAHDAAYRLGDSEIPLGEVSLDCAPATDAAAGSVCTLGNRGGNARLDGRLQLSPRGVSGSVELTPAGGVTQRFGF